MTKSDGDALLVEHVSKSYPGVRALNDVSLRVPAGSVHGLIGENGAGKSTLMKSVAGAHQIDSGSIHVFGTRLAGARPRQAADAGVAIIYQELTTIPELSAEANVFLGRPPTRWGVIDRRSRRAQYVEVAERVGTSIAPTDRAGSLSTAHQQLIEVMRALVTGRRLIIMDEPTASLGPEDIARLHAVIRDLRASGCSVVYVSHDLDAVLDVCDDITVLREGRVVATGPRERWSTPTMISAMLGGADLGGPAEQRSSRSSQRTLLEVRGLMAPGVNVPRLEIGAGEVVGIAGLVGSGRTRLLRTLAGGDQPDSGELHIDGKEVRWPRTPREARRLGIGLAPEDRKGQGLVLRQPSSWNVALGAFAAASRGPVVRRNALSAWAKKFTDSVGFSANRLAAAAGQLSGGNQQKLMLARLISRPLPLVLLDEPTRGIDIGAKAQVFATMRTLAESGRSVLWSSSEIDEVLEHSDRILVVSRGRLVGELPAGSTTHDVLELSFATTSTGSLSTAHTKEQHP